MIRSLIRLDEGLYKGTISSDQDPPQMNWIWYWHSDPRTVKTDVFGKWILHRNPKELEKIALSLHPLIISGEIQAIKYRPRLNDPYGLFSEKLPPICIYTSLKRKKIILKFLVERNLKDAYYRTESDTKQFYGRLRS